MLVDKCLLFQTLDHSILFCLVDVVLEAISFIGLAFWLETHSNKIDLAETVPSQLLKVKLT